MLPTLASRKKRSPVRREDIVDAAARLFADSGYESTSVRTIAGEIGLSVASLFHHFASKDSLLEAVIRKGLELGMAEVVAGLAGKTTPLRRLHALVDVHIRLVNGDMRHIHRVWTVEWLKLSDDARSRLDLQAEEYRAVCHDTMRVLFDTGHIYADPELSRHLLMPALNWTRTWLHSWPAGPDRNIGDTICAAFLNIPVEEFRKRLGEEQAIRSRCP